MSSTVIHLRRPLWALLLGFHGFGLLSLPVVGVMLAGVADGSADPLYLIVVLVGLLPVVGVLGARVVLFEDRIESGLRWFPKTVQRSDIGGAQEGKVNWGRGYMTGVVVWTEVGDLEPVVGSAPMSEKARKAWTAEINRWARQPS